MAMAKLMSLRATCLRKSAGCIIVKDFRVISTGYSGSPPGMVHCIDEGTCELDSLTGGCIRTQHAEANAIAWAARSGINVNGGIMYTTLSPCLACAKMIAMSGINEVVYLEQYRNNEGNKYLNHSGVISRHAASVELYISDYTS